MPEMTDEWLAGFFDGEGCVVVSIGDTTLGLALQMTQADPDVLYQIRDYIGDGVVYHADQKTGRRHYHYKLQCVSKVKALAERLSKYTRIKTAQLHRMIELCDFIEQNWRSRDPEYKARKYEMGREIQANNGGKRARKGG